MNRYSDDSRFVLMPELRVATGLPIEYPPIPFERTHKVLRRDSRPPGAHLGTGPTKSSTVTRIIVARPGNKRRTLTGAGSGPIFSSAPEHPGQKCRPNVI